MNCGILSSYNQNEFILLELKIRAYNGKNNEKETDKNIL